MKKDFLKALPLLFLTTVSYAQEQLDSDIVFTLLKEKTQMCNWQYGYWGEDSHMHKDVLACVNHASKEEYRYKVLYEKCEINMQENILEPDIM
jgi:hypothetical protein